MKQVLKIGTRGSELAMWQTCYVKSLISGKFPGIKIEIKEITTKGDLILDQELHKIGDKGLFTKELEKELLAGTIDAAVHSLKDMQVEMPEGLEIAAVTKRHNPLDALVSKDKGLSIQNLRQGAVVATGSLRRKAQLLALRPDLQITGLRGNINTRLSKYENSGWDCIILAAAGLERLGKQSYIAQYIPDDVIIPAVGQGAIAVQVSKSNTFAGEIISSIIDINTFICTLAEREFLRVMGGGCRTPMAAHAKISGDNLVISGLAAAEDGSSIIKNSVSGSIDLPDKAGAELAEIILSSGASAFINEY